MNELQKSRNDSSNKSSEYYEKLNAVVEQVKGVSILIYFSIDAFDIFEEFYIIFRKNLYYDLGSNLIIYLSLQIFAYAIQDVDKMTQ